MATILRAHKAHITVQSGGDVLEAHTDEEAHDLLWRLADEGQHIIYSMPTPIPKVTNEEWIISLFKIKQY